MNRQQKIAFFIGILALIVLDASYIRTSLEQDYIFSNVFPLYKLFNCDVWYHIGLLMVFIMAVLLVNGKKGYNEMNEKLDYLIEKVKK
jgi:low affinity Fe/Cu permease